MSDASLTDKLNIKLFELIKNKQLETDAKISKMEYLLKLGADENGIIFGNSMLFWAKKEKDDKIIEFLISKNAKEVAMSEEERIKLSDNFWDENNHLKSVEEIKTLFFKGADLAHKNRYRKQIWEDLIVDEMNGILKDLPKGYVIDGDVDLVMMMLEELPDFSHIEVKGNFDCSHNNIVSLKNAPEIVEGNFDCHSNHKLINLEGAPKFVGGDFRCFKDKNLTTLKGAPKEVHGSFDCRDNQLISLEGAPEIVDGEFFCDEYIDKTRYEMAKDIGVEKRLQAMDERIAKKSSKMKGFLSKIFSFNEER